MNNLDPRILYPAIEPYQADYLKVDATHDIYYEQCGNPQGAPVVFLHGGPGSGCNPAQRRFFDPTHYRIILLDQRGCGRSLPQGCVTDNTTPHLVSDIEQLRAFLGINRWHVFGGSWGSALALAYALTHPDRVASLCLRGIFLSRPQELDWFSGEVKIFFPILWQWLLDYLPHNQRSNPVQSYYELVFNTDPAISIPAAMRWNDFETNMMTLLPGKPSTAEKSQALELARARVQLHYIRNQCFMLPYDALNQTGKLKHIPTSIIQGRYDMVCPPITAWELQQTMPHADFLIVPDAGHSAMEPGIMTALLNATDKFRNVSV